MSEQFISLRDGRRLCVAQTGAATGPAVLYLVGLPGSRLQQPPDLSAVVRLGLRVLTVDRPGAGRSDPQPGRRFLDWPEDVRQLLDALGLKQVAILAASGGCPYALACALRLPERLRTVTIVSGPAPWQIPLATRGMNPPLRLLFAGTRRMPRLTRCLWPVFSLASRVLRRRGRWPLRHFVPPVDVATLNRPEVWQVMNSDFAEAIRPGPQGILRELALISNPWDFDPAAIQIPVRLWHGEADTIVPIAHGRWLAGRLRQCQATWVPGEGHFMIFTRAAELLAEAAGV